MAEIPVQRKSGVPWWVWLIGLLLLIAVVWFVISGRDRDRVTGAASPAPAPTSEAASAIASPPASQPTVAATAGAGPVTDPGLYASTVDKLALVDKEVALSSVQVVRVVGPKTFTIASGSEELFVMIDQDLSRGVGTQGQIDIGQSLNMKGTFKRLQQEEINDIANARFRDLTELERETLRKTEVYLHATEFSKIS